MSTSLTCKTCRRLGFSICGRAKCAFRRKPYPPGIHGKRARRGQSEFAEQLREKQKLRHLYRVQERQFSNYVKEASTSQTMEAGEKLLQLLEQRLDNIVYRSGFASTRTVARQMVSHGHVTVNGRKTKVPSYAIRTGDMISLTERAKQSGLMKDRDIILKNYVPPEWITLDKDSLKVNMASLPDIKEELVTHNTKIIIEYYAR